MPLTDVKNQAAMKHPRNALAEEIDSLAELWRNGWQDAHAGIVPAELVRLRTP